MLKYDFALNIAQAEHSRHRSFSNFITNLVASLIAYSFQEKKPSIKFETENSTQLSLFTKSLCPFQVYKSLKATN